MKLQTLTTVVVLAFCSLQAFALPTLYAETRDISNDTSISADTYTVVAGDTLDAIAAAEGITTQQLEDANPGVSPTDLQVGEVLNVTASANSTEASLKPRVLARQIFPRQTTYTLVSGDTVDTIATSQGISTQQLLDANPGIATTDLQVGQVLNLPGATSTNTNTAGIATATATASLLLPPSSLSTTTGQSEGSMATDAPASAASGNF